MSLINKELWAVAISLIMINSIYFSIKLHFPQLKLIQAIKSIKIKNEKDRISPTDTLVMALSSKIGVGSLSGTALCIYYGGIGTIFWIIVSTFFLSIITYIENALSIIYKDQKINKSGPNYYIKNGLKNNKLSTVYSVIVLGSYTFLFSSIQNNTIITLTTDIYNINKIFLSLIVTTITGIIIIKGIKTISKICNKVFPVMMIIFILIGLIIILNNILALPNIITLIIKDAFNYKSVKGGILNTIIITLQKSIFANEAGVGTSAIISGSTTSNNYQLQANIGLIQTYFINIIVLTITALIIALSNPLTTNITNGIELTKYAFSYHLGYFGEIILLIILALFSFSTIITVYYYGESSLTFLTKNKHLTTILKILTVISIFIGGIIKGTTIWKYIDISLAILTIINMYAIYKLKEIIIKKL